MGNWALKATALRAFVVVVAGASAGCSSSSAAPGATGGGGGGGGDNGCSAFKSDLQALITKPISSVTGTLIGACNGILADGTLGIAVVIYDPDTDKSMYNLQYAAGSSHSITGFGDEAFYNDGDQADGITGPDFHAHKGDVTCDIASPAPPNTTLKTTAAGTGYTATQSDELAYVQLMGKTCNDVFAADQ